MANSYDDSLKSDLGRLIPKSQKANVPLSDPKPATPISEAVGFGEVKSRHLSSKNLPSQGGIASPLTETLYEDREYYDEVAVTSSDGLFVFNIKRIKTIRMTDNTSKEVVLSFKNKVV
jgi:hypothetical protein